MAKRQKKGKIALGDDVPTNNPFAAALSGLSARVADPEELLPTEPEASARPLTVSTRVDRKGRRGKTVTLVEGLEELPADERAQIVTSLRKALGTGVSVEGTTLVVQGEMAKRIQAWFADY